MPRPRLLRGGAAPGSLFGGRYRVLARVGAGGMATVYRARDERLKREVAVKVIAEHLAQDAAFAQRFRREAELGAGLAHPNIVSVLDAGADPRAFIVMEFVDGVDACTLLQTRGPLTPSRTVDVVTQIADALAHSHARDVVHEDVSLRNILIRQPGRTAKLADFGLASGALDTAGSRVANLMGTAGFLAPEVMAGAAPSPRSDLYSLGVVAYRFLAGPARSDVHATTPLRTAIPRMQPLAQIRADLPPGLIDAVQQALALDPRRRQDSVSEFRAQLVEHEGAPVRLRSVA
jgi:serine/threonine-protein kinase